MNQEARDELNKRRKLLILDIAKDARSVSKTCIEFEIPRSSFYEWKKKYEADGIAGLIRKKPIPKSHPNQHPQNVIGKIIELRNIHTLGPQRITWYLECYHGITTSCSTVYRTLVRNGISRLPKTASRRAIHTKRYNKTVPGHHIQIDVSFIWLKTDPGTRIRRFQYTAIDDATRIRALRIYQRHNQASAIDFVNYVIEKFPFRIYTIQTDRRHEFQTQFHWHIEDIRIQHSYIKPRSPQLNGKVERSHQTDRDEFYHLLIYTDDANLNKKLNEWKIFYNFNRPHSAFNGKIPYEALCSLLNNSVNVSDKL